MFYTLGVWVPELPQDSVLSFVTNNARSVPVPPYYWGQTKTVRETPVRENLSAPKDPGHLCEFKLFGMNKKRALACSLCGEILREFPLDAEPVWHFCGARKRGVTSDNCQDCNVSQASHGNIVA